MQVGWSPVTWHGVNQGGDGGPRAGVRDLGATAVGDRSALGEVLLDQGDASDAVAVDGCDNVEVAGELV